MFPFPISHFAAGVSPAYYEAGGLYSTGTNATTYSNNLSLGAVDPDRYVIAFVSGRATTAASSVTINGVSASLISSTTDSGINRIEAWGATVPTDTSGTVSVTWGSAADCCCISIVSLYDLKSTTPFDTAVTPDDNVNDNTHVSTIDVESKGVVVCSGTISVASATATHNALTLVGNTTGASNALSMSTSAKAFALAETVTNTITWSSSDADKVNIALAFR